MTKQDMIDKIYEKIADKTLSFGCRIRRYYNQDDTFLYIEDYRSYTEYGIIWWINKRFYKLKTDPIEFWKNIIIWHPVLIWDVLDYLQSNLLLSECVEILWLRNNKRKPIEEQSESTIKYVYDLIQTIKW